MKKALISDLDGTLLNNGVLNLENELAIKRINKKDHLMSICTGRNFSDVKFLADNHNIKIDYYFLLNGALIMDSKLNIISQQFIDFNIVNSIISQYIGLIDGLLLTDGFTNFILKNGSHGYSYCESKYLKSNTELPNKISLISIYLGEDNEFNNKIGETIKNNLNNNFSNLITIHRNNNFLDIVPYGCSKSMSVEYIEKFENINNKNIYTIGDSWNDVPMLKISKNSFTFINSNKKVKSIVNNIVNSVSECINNYMLLND